VGRAPSPCSVGQARGPPPWPLDLLLPEPRPKCTLHIPLTAQGDKQVLDQLFKVFDVTGDGQINFREFVTGIAPLINLGLADVMRFAFEMFDVDNNKVVTRTEMRTMLKAMNADVSFFGDGALSEADIESIIGALFPADVPDGQGMDYSTFAHQMAAHPSLIRFGA